MSDLRNQTPSTTYKGLLQVNDYSNGVDATSKFVQDGEGTNSALSISTTKVGVGTSSPLAPLDVTSTTGGLVFPRLTTAQRDAISSPTNGETIYNTTTTQVESYNGTSWIAGGGGTVTSVGSSTGLTGGPITSSGTLSIANNGVDTAQIAANAVTSTEIASNTITATQISDTDTTFNIDSSGRVGIGRVAAAGKLEIDGDLLVVDTTDNNPVAKFSGTAGATIQLEDSATTGTNNQKFNLSSLGGAFALGSVNDDNTSRAVLLYLYPKATSGGVAQLPSISTADLNAAQTGFTAGAGMIAYVTDGDSGSACLAVHDGTSFKRVALGATISAT